ncbi:hypothetical protein [Microbacterium sediminis]|uniref:hypothetical protein n=1 Tax=Microbacterium sediminis TaxID=904291 RepID=UPI0010729110|nr:hypothetical protein [Microbacterium sediminis]QBR75611.1 hypothetical protein E3O41_13615 [Microbacterium sediminis]
MKKINELIIRAQATYAEGIDRLKENREDGAWYEDVPWMAVMISGGVVLALALIAILSGWAQSFFTGKLGGIS